MPMLITDDPNQPIIVGGNAKLTVGRITFAPATNAEETINESRRLARAAIEKHRREKRRQEIFEKVKTRIFGK